MGKWSSEFNNFVREVLNKNENERPSVEALLNHEFLKDAENYKSDFVEYLDDIFK
jgi:serine/threonine protein kinase